MPQYKIRKAGIRQIRRKALLKSLPLLVLALVFGVGISQYSAGEGRDLGMLVYLVPGMMVMLAFGLYMNSQRQKLLLKSYTLTVSDSSIKREQLQTPTIELPFSHIQEISKTEDGGFTIKGRDAQDIIVVPAQIKQAAELENLLKLIKPLKVSTKKR